MAAKITVVGPVVIIQDDAQETVATFQVCYNQANLATFAITVWEIDGYVETTSLSGTNEDRPRFWTTFLGLLPSCLAIEIAASLDSHGGETANDSTILAIISLPVDVDFLLVFKVFVSLSQLVLFSLHVREPWN